MAARSHSDELMLRAQVNAAVIGNSRAVRQIVELWLSYHSDRPDRVDYHFEQQVMVGTHRKLNELYAVQCAEDEKRRRKEMKSAQRKKSRAERARKKKRAEAEAARMAATEAAELAAWKAARAAAAHTAGSATNVVVGSPPAGSR